MSDDERSNELSPGTSSNMDDEISIHSETMDIAKAMQRHNIQGMWRKITEEINK